MAQNNVLHGPVLKYQLEDITLGQFFFDCAERYKDRVCQIDATLDQSETYASVKQRTVRLALELQSRGITPKDVIFICSYNSLDTTVLIIASFYLGAKVVNMDPVWMIDHITYLISLVSPTLIFVDENYVKTLERGVEEAGLKIEIIVFGKSSKWFVFSSLIEPHPDEYKFRPVGLNIHDVAIMFFSSGITGLPKAICHSHASFLQITQSAANCGLDFGIKFNYMSFSNITAMIALSATFISGYTRVFSHSMPEGDEMLRIMAKYEVTAILMTSAHTYKITGASDLKKYDVSSVRTVLVTGSILSTDQYHKMQSAFPNASIIICYEMTEAGFISVFNQITDKNLIKRKIGSCGKLTPTNIMKVIDPDTEDILGPEEKGEIRLKSSCLMTGYYKQDSSDRFDNEGFLKTGDLGYYDSEDCIYLVDKLKEVFKYNGQPIIPALIESVLLQHPAVQEAVVVGIPDIVPENELPAAFVVLKEKKRASTKDIENFVNERVSDSEKLRGGVMIVPKFPKNEQGKVKKKEVRHTFMTVRE